eukprot:jgi/Botrbrau1/16658/Bobra.0068s0074.1
MAFFSRIINYVVNQVLVDGLANNPTFQRFAIKSNAQLEQLAKQAAEQKAKLGEQTSSFIKVFQEEVQKGLSEQMKNARRSRSYFPTGAANALHSDSSLW